MTANTESPGPSFVRVADLRALPPGGMLRVRLAGRHFLLLHTAAGLHAVDDLCSHEDFSLSYGCVQEGLLKCSLHGSRFDLRTGRPLEPPATEPIGVYAVQAVGDGVWLDPERPINGPVDLGGAAQSDT